MGKSIASAGAENIDLTDLSGTNAAELRPTTMRAVYPAERRSASFLWIAAISAVLLAVTRFDPPREYLENAMTSGLDHDNPYQSPTTELSSRENKILLFYRSMRDTPPTFGSLYARYIPVHFTKAVLFIGIAGLLYVLLRESAAVNGFCFFLAGAFLGSVARDLGVIRRTLHAWPILADIIDWRRVEKLLDRPSGDLPPPHDQ